jgi:small subunit ribosomal protein S6
MAARTYELGFIIDPRISEEEAVALTDAVKELVTNGGAVVDKEESWGKRRLAYPINKLNEGRYVFLYLTIPEGGPNPLAEAEKRLNQNEKILRYLTVRTDKDLKRQASKGKVQPAESSESEERERE